MNIIYQRQCFRYAAGLLTRNSSLETEYTDAECAQKKVFDGMASASIISNCAGIDTSNTHVITMSTLRKFLETRQMEMKSEDEVRAIIKVCTRHSCSPPHTHTLSTVEYLFTQLEASVKHTRYMTAMNLKFAVELHDARVRHTHKLIQKKKIK